MTVAAMIVPLAAVDVMRAMAMGDDASPTRPRVMVTAQARLLRSHRPALGLALHGMFGRKWRIG